jgi:hypothetical protein
MLILRYLHHSSMCSGPWFFGMIVVWSLFSPWLLIGQQTFIMSAMTEAYSLAGTGSSACYWMEARPNSDHSKLFRFEVQWMPVSLTFDRFNPFHFIGVVSGHFVQRTSRVCAQTASSAAIRSHGIRIESGESGEVPWWIQTTLLGLSKNHLGKRYELKVWLFYINITIWESYSCSRSIPFLSDLSIQANQTLALLVCNCTNMHLIDHKSIGTWFFRRLFPLSTISFPFL